MSEPNSNSNLEKNKKNVAGPESWLVECITDSGDKLELPPVLTLRSAFKAIEILDRRLLPVTIKSLKIVKALDHTNDKDAERN